MYHTHYWGSLVGLHFRLLHHTEMIFLERGVTEIFYQRASSCGFMRPRHARWLCIIPITMDPELACSTSLGPEGSTNSR